MEDKFAIMCANTAHPSGDLKYFLLEDDDENTVIFTSENDAEAHIKNEVWKDGPICYAVVTLGDLDFKF